MPHSGMLRLKYLRAASQPPTALVRVPQSPTQDVRIAKQKNPADLDIHSCALKNNVNIGLVPEIIQG